MQERSDGDDGAGGAAVSAAVVAAKCGCLVLEDEVCSECGSCGARHTEWSGCCACRGVAAGGGVVADATSLHDMLVDAAMELEHAECPNLAHAVIVARALLAERGGSFVVAEPGAAS